MIISPNHLQFVSFGGELLAHLPLAARGAPDEAPPPTLTDLASAKGFWYLGSPYTNYFTGRETAFRLVSWIAADLMRRGVVVFSPIAHSHPIAVHGALDEIDLDFWLEQDQPLIDAAAGMVVAMMPGWRDSKGTAYEIAEFKKAGKPYYFLDIDTMELT